MQQAYTWYTGGLSHGRRWLQPSENATRLMKSVSQYALATCVFDKASLGPLGAPVSDKGILDTETTTRASENDWHYAQLTAQVINM